MDKYDYAALANEVVQRNINLFGDFNSWTKGAFALSCLGEEGRHLFKRISQLSDKYVESENDKKFNNALHTNNKVNISSFIYMCQQAGVDTNKFFKKTNTGDKCQPMSPSVNRPMAQCEALDIPSDYVDKSVDRFLRSDLLSYLKGLLPDEIQLVAIVDAYHVGITKEGDALFWYIDTEGYVRYGKTIAYGKDGHRNHAKIPGSIPNELRRQGKLQVEYSIKKTLFGEHLLTTDRYKDKMVAIVESEKSAIICALCVPDVLWLATGSLNNLQTERMESVKSRRVILYPDLDEVSAPYKKWSDAAQKLNQLGWHIQVSDYLERIATIEQRKNKQDIADFLVADLVSDLSHAE